MTSVAFDDDEEIQFQAEQIYFEPTMCELEPSGKMEIKVHYKAGEPERYKELFEMVVQNGNSRVFHVSAIV